MLKDDKLTLKLYVRELEGARRREEMRRQNQTFFYVGIDDAVTEEIEHAVKYNHWGMR